MTQTNLADLPVTERLKMMESLWDSLCHQGHQAPASPPWHSDVLSERLARLAEGREVVSPWSEAKQRIRERIQAG